MKKTVWTLMAAGVLGATMIGSPAVAQGRGRGSGSGNCDGTGQRIHQRLRDGSGAGRRAQQGGVRGNGLRLRDGSGPNPYCPLKQK
jgi:hypothetical protein